MAAITLPKTTSRVSQCTSRKVNERIFSETRQNVERLCGTDQETLGRRLDESAGKLCAAVGDRGFDSAGSRKKLAEEEAFNGLCPRDTNEMARRMREDEAFVGAQKRRAQTEGRIGILKNVFLQGIPRAKGFTNRELQVDWAVLAHNLWVAARVPWASDHQAKAA